MKKTLLLSLSLSLATTAFTQTTKDYETSIRKFQQSYNMQLPDSVFSLFSDRIKNMLPLDKTKEMLNKMSAEFGPMRSFEFSNKDEHFSYYKTVFNKGLLTLVVFLNPDNKLQSFRFIPYQADTVKSNFSLKTTTGTVYGTLVMPEVTDKKVPVVLIIAGSGPTDRDGNNPAGVKTNAYLLIADSLKKAGIASVRYDKRGIGESVGAMKSEETETINDLMNDAAGFIKMIKDDKRFSKVIVLGHSEGSLIGMVAANKEKVNGYISVAGIGERADKIIEQQLAAQSKDLAAQAKVLLDSLVKGYRVTTTDPTLSNLFHPSVQPYMISWLKYDPKTEIKKVTAKILIVQGTTDIQVGTEQADILKKAAPHSTLKLVRGMNHVLKEAPADQQKNVATYSNPDLPLCPGFMPVLIDFIIGD